MNTEPRCCLFFCQHSALAQSVVARSELVLPNEIGDAFGCETSIPFISTRNRSGTVSLAVEDIGDLGKYVIVEKLVDQLDDSGIGFDQLTGRFWAQGNERVGFAALETNVDLGGSSLRQFDQCDVFNNVGKQALSFAVRGLWTGPELFEVSRHCDQPFVDGFIEDE